MLPINIITLSSPLVNPLGNIFHTLNGFESFQNKRYNEINTTFRVEKRHTMKANRETISSMIGERIRTFRTEQKLSQEELAFNSELHPAYIGKVERGEKCPTIETLYKIANGLKIPLHKLLDIDSGTAAEENDAFYRIRSAMDGLRAEEMLKVAQIVEQITELMRNHA